MQVLGLFQVMASLELHISCTCTVAPRCGMAQLVQTNHVSLFTARFGSRLAATRLNIALERLGFSCFKADCGLKYLDNPS